MGSICSTTADVLNSTPVVQDTGKAEERGSTTPEVDAVVGADTVSTGTGGFTEASDYWGSAMSAAEESEASSISQQGSSTVSTNYSQGVTKSVGEWSQSDEEEEMFDEDFSQHSSRFSTGESEAKPDSAWSQGEVMGDGKYELVGERDKPADQETQEHAERYENLFAHAANEANPIKLTDAAAAKGEETLIQRRAKELANQRINLRVDQVAAANGAEAGGSVATRARQSVRDTANNPGIAVIKPDRVVDEDEKDVMERFNHAEGETLNKEGTIAERMARIAAAAGGGGYNPGFAVAHLGPQIIKGFEDKRKSLRPTSVARAPRVKPAESSASTVYTPHRGNVAAQNTGPSESRTVESNVLNSRPKNTEKATPVVKSFVPKTEGAVIRPSLRPVTRVSERESPAPKSELELVRLRPTPKPAIETSKSDKGPALLYKQGIQSSSPKKLRAQSARNLRNVPEKEKLKKGQRENTENASRGHHARRATPTQSKSQKPKLRSKGSRKHRRKHTKEDAGGAGNKGQISKSGERRENRREKIVSPEARKRGYVPPEVVRTAPIVQKVNERASLKILKGAVKSRAAHFLGNSKPLPPLNESNPKATKASSTWPQTRTDTELSNTSSSTQSSQVGRLIAAYTKVSQAITEEKNLELARLRKHLPSMPSKRKSDNQTKKGKTRISWRKSRGKHRASRGHKSPYGVSKPVPNSKMSSRRGIESLRMKLDNTSKEVRGRLSKSIRLRHRSREKESPRKYVTRSASFDGSALARRKKEVNVKSSNFKVDRFI